MPAANGRAFDRPTAALLSLAEGAPSLEPALLLRNFLGSFVCCKYSSVQGPMRAIWPGLRSG